MCVLFGSVFELALGINSRQNIEVTVYFVEFWLVSNSNMMQMK